MPLDSVAQVMLLAAVWIGLHMFTKATSDMLAYEKKERARLPRRKEKGAGRPTRSTVSKNPERRSGFFYRISSSRLSSEICAVTR